jgi:hypothetical protein
MMISVSWKLWYLDTMFQLCKLFPTLIEKQKKRKQIWIELSNYTMTLSSNYHLNLLPKTPFDSLFL